jgi:hypothetical protein
MHLAFQEICEDEAPWVALGNFLNYWFAYAKERRPDLVAEPIQQAQEQEYYQRWAAYCAASVEHLCHLASVPCPQWVHDPNYVLPTPWYDIPRQELLFQVRDRLRATTPEAFSKRNIYSGNRMFLTKWDLAEMYGLPPAAKGMDDDRPIEELLLEREKIRAQARNRW